MLVGVEEQVSKIRKALDSSSVMINARKNTPKVLRANYFSHQKSITLKCEKQIKVFLNLQVVSLPFIYILLENTFQKAQEIKRKTLYPGHCSAH